MCVCVCGWVSGGGGGFERKLEVGRGTSSTQVQRMQLNKSLTPTNCEEAENSYVLGVARVSKFASSIIWEPSWIILKTEAVGSSEQSCVLINRHSVQSRETEINAFVRMSNLALERYQNQSRIYEHTGVQQPSASQAEFCSITLNIIPSLSSRNKCTLCIMNKHMHTWLTVIIYTVLYCSDKEQCIKNCQSSVHLFVHYTYSKKCTVQRLK